MTDSSMDRRIADAARQGAADGFGPGFADRVLARTSSPTRRVPTLRLVRWSAAVAATIVALLLVDTARIRAVTAPLGLMERVSLSDGTSVTLAPGSTLSYRSFRMRSTRSVRLTGQAFFEVQPGSKPFVVSTFNGRVVVTGTRFDVRSWPNEIAAATLVSLEEGAVVVETTDGNGRLALSPGQSARVGETAPEIDVSLTVPEAVSWRGGGVTLVDVDLLDLAAELARRFDLRIEVDPALRGRLATYVDPEQRRIEDVLDAVCFALDLGYRPIHGGFRIEPNQTR